MKLCKTQKLFQNEMRKVVFSFGPGSEAQALRSLLIPHITKQEGAQHKIGKAPKGYMERELEDWLTAMAE